MASNMVLQWGKPPSVGVVSLNTGKLNHLCSKSFKDIVEGKLSDKEPSINFTRMTFKGVIALMCYDTKF